MAKEDTTQLEPIYGMVAAKIRHLRQTLDITQDDLAKRTGMSRPSIVNIEAGRQRVQLHDIETFANAFATTPRNFIKGIWV